METQNLGSPNSGPGRENKRIYLSMISSISCSTSNNTVNVSKLRDVFTVCGTKDGITWVAIKFTVKPYFLSLKSILYIPEKQEI